MAQHQYRKTSWTKLHWTTITNDNATVGRRFLHNAKNNLCRYSLLSASAQSQEGLIYFAARVRHVQ